MLLVAGVGAGLLVPLMAALVVTSRRLQRECIQLDVSAARLVRLMVAVDDLQHEAARVRPDIDASAVRYRELRRPGERQLDR